MLTPTVKLNSAQGRCVPEPTPAERVLHLVLVRLHVGDQLLQIVHRQALARDQEARRFRDHPDRLEVLGRVVGLLLVERLAVGVGAGVADQERVAVGRRLGDAAAADGAGRGADVLHHDGLAEDLAEHQRLQPRAGVDAAARRERHDQRDRCGSAIPARRRARRARRARPSDAVIRNFILELHALHSSAHSILHAARLDRHAPALDLALHELGEIFRAAAVLRRDHDADALVALDHRRRVDRVAGRLGERSHDRLRRALGEREAAPGAAVEALQCRARERSGRSPGRARGRGRT